MQQEDFFHQKFGLKFTKEASEVLHNKRNFIWRWNWDISENK
jgi:hypothetical protein